MLDERPEFQFHLLEEGEIVARACTIPTRWDGSTDDLPQGIDDAVVRSFDGRGEPTVLCALLIAIPREHRGASGQH